MEEAGNRKRERGLRSTSSGDISNLSDPRLSLQWGHSKPEVSPERTPGPQASRLSQGVPAVICLFQASVWAPVALDLPPTLLWLGQVEGHYGEEALSCPLCFSNTHQVERGSLSCRTGRQVRSRDPSLRANHSTIRPFQEERG